MEFRKWKQHAKTQSFTIKDLMSLKRGDKIKFAVFDRNLCDVVIYNNDHDVNIEPQQFMRDSWAIFTYDSDTKGEIIWEWDKTGTCDEFEFHIYLTDKQCWYPLTNGVLPAEDDSFELYGVEKHYTEFPKDTILGWRGSMVPFDKISNLPQVYIH